MAGEIMKPKLKAIAAELVAELYTRCPAEDDRVEVIEEMMKELPYGIDTAPASRSWRGISPGGWGNPAPRRERSLGEYIYKSVKFIFFAPLVLILVLMLLNSLGEPTKQEQAAKRTAPPNPASSAR